MGNSKDYKDRCTKGVAFIASVVIAAGAADYMPAPSFALGSTREGNENRIKPRNYMAPVICVHDGRSGLAETIQCKDTGRKREGRDHITAKDLPAILEGV